MRISLDSIYFHFVATVLIVCVALPSFAVDESTLGMAIENDDVRMLRNWISNGEVTKDQFIDVVPYGPNGIPIIGLAARAGSEKVIQYLISIKSNLNSKTTVGETALVLASYFGSTTDSGKETFDKHDRIVSALVAAGADLENGTNYSALAYTAFKNRIKTAQILLSAGADPDSMIQDGYPVNTPLMAASHYGYRSFAKMLLVKGANPRITVANGRTALGLAKKYNHQDLVVMIQCALALSPGQGYEENCP